MSWQGVNDLSAHPAPTGHRRTRTDRHGRPQHPGRPDQPREPVRLPRFANDFQDVYGGNRAPPDGDGLTDDFNGDNVPDYYPTLYPERCSTPRTGPTVNAAVSSSSSPRLPPRPRRRLLRESWLSPSSSRRLLPAPDPELANDATTAGFTRPTPDGHRTTATPSSSTTTPGSAYLQNMNHNPLDVGDNLPTPPSGNAWRIYQTWWGFPTWRETLSP